MRNHFLYAIKNMNLKKLIPLLIFIILAIGGFAAMNLLKEKNLSGGG
jgi:hypothetical protein